MLIYRISMLLSRKSVIFEAPEKVEELLTEERKINQS